MTGDMAQMWPVAAVVAAALAVLAGLTLRRRSFGRRAPMAKPLSAIPDLELARVPRKQEPPWAVNLIARNTLDRPVRLLAVTLRYPEGAVVFAERSEWPRNVEITRATAAAPLPRRFGLEVVPGHELPPAIPGAAAPPPFVFPLRVIEASSAEALAVVRCEAEVEFAVQDGGRERRAVTVAVELRATP